MGGKSLGNARQSLLLALALIAYGEIAAQTIERCQPPVGQIASVQGSVELRRAGKAQWQAAQLNDTLCAGDMIRVKERSRGSVALVNETFLRLDQKTTVTLVAIEEPKPSLLELCRGAIHFMTRTRKSLRVITPFVNAAVEGTEFSIEHAEAQDNISVFEGQVSATNEAARPLPETCEESPKPATQGGMLVLGSGESGVVPVDQAPFKLPQVVVRPEDSVQWALYYPPISDYFIRDEFAAPGIELDSQIRESIEHYRNGRLADALSSIERSPEDQVVRDPRFFTYRAGLLLTVGRVDEARADIQQALDIDSRNSAAYALQAIISVVQNDKAAALKLAQTAVQLDEKSSDAWIALSYAQQANFRIEEALESARKGVEVKPENALAWARVAELELSLGKLDEALEAAQRAVALSPNLARTQTVLGFANLTRIDTETAKASFQKAIELDQADPLPRLGLGLAKIRESNLEAGRREIEIAANLDPADSLIRSYLGKAYFEERREKLAGIQFDIAKTLDPLDPTPWFYDAIRKQTINQPVEALRDVEKSIELNDNRAVYRSGLLLDQDRATRGTSLARIYDDLGFDQPALVEASKSLSIDPANHSAHRFLSDTYARLPRHEIARVSELLQAQLLQPINVNPVQPRLSVTDLNIVSGAGPAEAAFNEFTPLFERDRPQFVVSGIAGNNDTWGDEAVLSGLSGRLSYSLGQFHYETDGFRENNDLQHDIYNVFAQYAVTPDLNVQAELRSRETDNGDITLNFDPQNLATKDRTQIDRDTARVGIHASISPRSDVIASLIHEDESATQEFFFDDPDLSGGQEQADQRGYLAEAQYLYRAPRSNLVAGGGSYRIRARREETLFFTDGTIGEFPDTSFILKQRNGYAYANVEYPERFIWTLGLSFDSFRNTENDISLNEWSPKLGLQWYPNNNLRIRFAAFETVKRALIAGQTIEPTQIAGFNQFFDDVNGTKAHRYGFGVDGRLVEQVYVGMEVSERDLATPISLFSGGIVTEDSTENLYQAYLLWILKSGWVVAVEYRHDKFERMPAVMNQFPVLARTVSVPVTVRYFMPRGFFAQLSASHVRQTVDREFTFAGIGEGRESFEVVDAALGFRDPKRRFILSIEGRNLLDKKFTFQDENFRTPETSNSPLIPDRTIFLRATLNF